MENEKFLHNGYVSIDFPNGVIYTELSTFYTEDLERLLQISDGLSSEFLDKVGYGIYKFRKELKIKGFEIKEQKGDLIIFKEGTYNVKTGEAKYTKKELPYVLKKMTELHKSDSKHKFYLLNTIFGISLFFFVISSFWMFNPKSQIFRKGMIATVIGLVLALFLTLA